MFVNKKIFKIHQCVQFLKLIDPTLLDNFLDVSIELLVGIPGTTNCLI